MAKKDEYRLPDCDVIESNLRQCYEQISMRDFTDGMRWYAEARQVAQVMSAHIGEKITIEQAAAVIAVLSPAQKWERQSREMVRIVDLWHKGHDWRNVRYGFKRNLAKAWRIMDGDPTALVGYKVQAFWQNIIGCMDYVTVDRWSLRVAIGHTVTTVKPVDYPVLVQCFRKVAKQVGLSPRDLQAILWVWARRTDSRAQLRLAL